MTTAELGILITTAISVGVVHTLMGPDHYVPFIAMSRAQDWTIRRTMTVTICCGLGHVGSSVVIGVVGVVLGALVMTMEQIQSFQGELAGWLLIAFGMVYAIWGVQQARRATRHRHADGTVHTHRHFLGFSHSHRPLVDSADRKSNDSLPAGATMNGLSPWVLFLIFAFGPCEALVPLVSYTAIESGWVSVAVVVVAFAFATLLAMVSAVLVGRIGLNWLRLPDLHHYSHVMAGLTVLACGLAIKFGL